jgi:hypothetical protein
LGLRMRDSAETWTRMEAQESEGERDHA